MTTDRAITLRDWEVRAVLNGATQIRRVVKPQPRRTEAQGILSDMEWWTWQTDVLYSPLALTDNVVAAAPFQPGQRLWVRETWAPSNDNADSITYKADGTAQAPSLLMHDGTEVRCYWKPSIHMPRWASRITLEVTSTGAGRVQEITYEDILAMGWDAKTSQPMSNGTAGEDALAWAIACWNDDNKQYPWRDNTWNWVYGVRRIE